MKRKQEALSKPLPKKHKPEFIFYLPNEALLIFFTHIPPKQICNNPPIFSFLFQVIVLKFVLNGLLLQNKTLYGNTSHVQDGNYFQTHPNQQIQYSLKKIHS